MGCQSGTALFYSALESLARPLRGPGLPGDRPPFPALLRGAQGRLRSPPAPPEGGAHASLDSRSHWLLPVANPRDRRGRAPPPDPAPSPPPGGGSGSAARSCRTPSPRRPARRQRACAHKVAVPRRWSARRGRASRAGRRMPARTSRKSFNERKHARARGSARPPVRSAPISGFRRAIYTSWPRWHLPLSPTQNQDLGPVIEAGPWRFSGACCLFSFRDLALSLDS